MICKVYPYKEGDELPETAIAEGRFVEYTPGEGYADFEEYKANGWSYKK